MNNLRKHQTLLLAALMVTVADICHGDDGPVVKPAAKPVAKPAAKAVAKPLEKPAAKAPAAPAPFLEWAKLLTKPVIELRPGRILVAPVAVQVEAVEAVEFAVPVQAVVIDIAVDAVPVQQAKPVLRVDAGKAETAVEILDADVNVLAGPVLEAIGEKIVVKKKVDPDVNQAVVQQFTQQYRPILMAELAFVRQTCSYLPEKDRKTIRQVGEASLREAARQFAVEQAWNQRPQNGIRATRPETKSPRSVIRQGLADGLKKVLSEDQWKEYSSEFEDRMTSRKNAVLLDTVARLDNALHLTAAQREKIRDSINSGWQEKWEEWLMIYMYNDVYYPMIPDNLVLVHLNAEQKSIWPNLQKINFGYYEQFQAVPDDWWGPEAKDGVPNGVQGVIIVD
ncbi:MAG: hypothetical protein WCJ09_08025 [Planctomycetota bacterium]